MKYRAQEIIIKTFSPTKAKQQKKKVINNTHQNKDMFHNYSVTNI